jgi:hypothetical protein
MVSSALQQLPDCDYGHDLLPDHPGLVDLNYKPSGRDGMKDGMTSDGKLFERLSGLYQKDPEEFERISKALIHEALEKLPAEHRARGYGLQMRIDRRLSHFKDPVARMNEMVVMFWEQFNEFQEVLNDPVGAAAARKKGGTTAKVIPLNGRSTRH